MEVTQHEPSTVGRMVSAIAAAMKMTQTELAQRAQIHRNRLADKIAGRREFTESEILRLAEALGVPPARLFENPLELLGVAPSYAVSSSASSYREVRRSGRVQNRASLDLDLAA